MNQKRAEFRARNNAAVRACRARQRQERARRGWVEKHPDLSAAEAAQAMRFLRGLGNGFVLTIQTRKIVRQHLLAARAEYNAKCAATLKMLEDMPPWD